MIDLQHILNSLVFFYLVSLPFSNFVAIIILIYNCVKNENGKNITQYFFYSGFDIFILYILFVIMLLKCGFGQNLVNLIYSNNILYESGFNNLLVYTLEAILAISIILLLLKIKHFKDAWILGSSLFIITACGFAMWAIGYFVSQSHPLTVLQSNASPNHQYSVNYYYVKENSVPWYVYGLKEESQSDISPIAPGCKAHFVRWVDNQTFLMQINMAGKGNQVVTASVKYPNICPAYEGD